MVGMEYDAADRGSHVAVVMSGKLTPEPVEEPQASATSGPQPAPWRRRDRIAVPPWAEPFSWISLVVLSLALSLSACAGSPLREDPLNSALNIVTAGGWRQTVGPSEFELAMSGGSHRVFYDAKCNCSSFNLRTPQGKGKILSNEDRVACATTLKQLGAKYRAKGMRSESGLAYTHALDCAPFDPEVWEGRAETEVTRNDAYGKKQAALYRQRAAELREELQQPDQQPPREAAVPRPVPTFDELKEGFEEQAQRWDDVKSALAQRLREKQAEDEFWNPDPLRQLQENQERQLKQFRAARLAHCGNLVGPFQVKLTPQNGPPNATFHVRVLDSGAAEPMFDYEFVSVQLPVALSQELVRKASARDVKVSGEMDLPFFTWLMRTRGLHFQGPHGGAIVTSIGECARLVSIRAADAPAAALMALTKMLRESRFAELDTLVSQYLDSTNPPTSPAPGQPGGATGETTITPITLQK